MGQGRQLVDVVRSLRSSPRNNEAGTVLRGRVGKGVSLEGSRT
jgi:hypothetical protein